MTDEEAAGWMTFYYLRPAPDDLVTAVRALAAANVLKGQKAETGLAKLFGRRPKASINLWQPGSDWPLIAFVAKVFEQNPTRVAGWLDDLPALGEGRLRSLWIAAWLSRAEGADAAVRRQAQAISKAAVRFAEEWLRQVPHTIESLEIDGPLVLDLNWAAFFASGDERYVLRVVEGLGAVASPRGSPRFALGTSALWSLTSNAQEHPRVREICAGLLPHASEGMRMMLEQIVTGQRIGNVR